MCSTCRVRASRATHEKGEGRFRNPVWELMAALHSLLSMPSGANPGIAEPLQRSATLLLAYQS